MAVPTRQLLLVSVLSILLLAALFPLSGVKSSQLPPPPDDENAPPRILAWNDLGMHCIDPDFAVFTILPPFNTINAHLIIEGQIQDASSGYTVTYEAVADPSGSINKSSIGKTNFWDHVGDLFGATPPLDVGLTGHAMPGAANVPQAMNHDPIWNWFQGEGIPITPIDDANQENAYPLMRIVARDSSGQEVASTVTSVPTSRELDCDRCHASNASPWAKPAAGWVFHPDPLKDDRLNILRLHDEFHLSEATYQAALVSAGYNAAGLFETVITDATPILCARCHASNALPGTGITGVTPLTAAIHSRHANVKDIDGRELDAIGDRNACFTCHPGFETQCLRGAMGKAIGDDGQHSMDCQSCHGEMAAVGDAARVGWLDQPTCENCHSGTATNNSGEIRYTSALDAMGQRRIAADNTYATTPDVPATGFSLYRFSEGHGGLQCSACHGPPHAIYPTSEPNDNLQSILIQGHEGTISDCSACHDQLEDDEMVGPHGMHPATQQWADHKHADIAENMGLASCEACHGADASGTVLSLAKADRTFNTEFGVKTFFRGSRIGCFACHDGPDDDDAVNNVNPVVTSFSATTPNDQDLVIPLSGTDADGDLLQLRIVDQPLVGGTVAIAAGVATFLPTAGFVGSTTFSYAAWDGKVDSNLGLVTVTVGVAACAGTIEAYGFGCPGSGDFLPQISVTGCPEPGGTVTLALDGALGGSLAYIIVGSAKSQLELPDGCVIRVGAISNVFGPFALAGSGAGNGAFSVFFTFDPALPPTQLNLQVLVLDGGATNGEFSLTNALEVNTPYAVQAGKMRGADNSVRARARALLLFAPADRKNSKG